jgi:hypothetical protein
MSYNQNQRNTVVRKWVRENGAATFNFNDKQLIINDGLLFSIESKLKELPALNIKCNQPGEHFDFAANDIVLTQGALFFIEKEIKKLNKIKDVKSTSTRGIYQVQLSKHKYKTECYKCRIWFRELCSMITYFKSMEEMLNGLGYDTGRKTNGKKI